MEIKIQIKSIFGSVLFEYSKENNTIKDTLCEANLRGANLCEADLCEANLRGADHNEGTAFLLSQCPDGAFIGYKKSVKSYS